MFATLTTTLIVFAVFGKLELALAVGVIESSTKIILYFVHERAWNKIKFGKKKISPFVLWFTGLPLSGKTTIADLVYKKLKEIDSIALQRLDSKQIRNTVPEIGYTREDRLRHLKRLAFFVNILESNSVSVVASFVSPYMEARKFIRENTTNFIEIYVKASVDACIKRDYKGVYGKSEKGEIKNLTGVDDVYEEPNNPNIILDTEKNGPDELADVVVKYVKEKLIKSMELL